MPFGKGTDMRWMIGIGAALGLRGSAMAGTPDLPRAIYADPPVDSVHPAATISAELASHTFDDHRIALEVTVLDWLAKLPGGPAQR